MADEQARKHAFERVKAKREFQQHLVSFAAVNLFLWVIWAVVGAGFPWPIFVTVGWGIGLAIHGWFVYGDRPITEAEIRREMERGGDSSPLAP